MIALVNKVAATGGLSGLTGPAIEALGSVVPDNSLRIDHVGIVVRSIASARIFYEALGLLVSTGQTMEHERVRVAMLSLGESRLELIEPLDEDSAIARSLAKRGEGMHHIALYSDQIDAKFETLRAQGVRMASHSIRVGAGGHRYFFVHPASTGGVLIEIVGAPASGAAAGSEKES